MRYENLLTDTQFDIALGELIAPFANKFTNPPAYWWKEWPDWLLQDQQGVIIPNSAPGICGERRRNLSSQLHKPRA